MTELLAVYQAMTELRPPTFVVGDIIQYKDVRSQDPQSRDFWYEDKVVETKNKQRGSVIEICREVSK